MIDHRPDRLPARPPTVSAPPAVHRAPGRPSPCRGPGSLTRSGSSSRGRSMCSPPTPRRAALGRPAPPPRQDGRRAARRGRRRRDRAARGRRRRPRRGPGQAEALAAWLDVHAPRSRARRAASGRAPISFIIAAVSSDDDGPADERPERPLDPAERPLETDVVRPQAIAPRRAANADDAAEPHYAVLPDPERRRRRARLRVRSPGRRRLVSPTASRRPSPATRPSPCRSSRASSRPNGSWRRCAPATPSRRPSSRPSRTSCAPR